MDLIQFYSMWMIRKVSSAKFIDVYVLLCVDRGALTVKRCGPKTGVVLGDRGYHCLQRQFARSGQTSEFHICPLKCRPLYSAAGAPLRAATGYLKTDNSESQESCPRHVGTRFT